MEELKEHVNKKSSSHLTFIPFKNTLATKIEQKYFDYIIKNIDRNVPITKLSNELNNIDIAIKIEAGIYEYTILYTFTNNYKLDYITGIYNEKLNNILFDLKYITKNNKVLLDKPQEIPFLESHVINNENWKLVKRRIDLREAKKNNITATDLYECKKCGESKCTVYQEQIRSADEPITTFITCLVCYNQFKK